MTALWLLLPLKLVEVLAAAEARGPEQQAASAQIPVARAEVHTARMLPNPGILLGGGRSEPVFDALLQFRLPIFGQRGAHIEAAERAVVQTANEAAAVRWKLRHDARIAYYTVARADEQVVIAAEIEQLTGRIAAIARERFEVGSGTRLDQRQAELVHVRALQDVTDRKAAARIARLELARQLGVSAESLGEVGDPLAQAGATPSLEELLGAAQTSHPEMRVAQSELAVARAQEHAARADRRPIPALEIGIEILDPSTCGTTNYCVGPRGALGFDLPILNLNGGPIERAQAEGKLALAKAAAIEIRVTSGVRSAWEALSAARLRARFFDLEYVPNATEVEAMAREAFSVGRSGILPLIEAERAVLDARLGRTEALFAVQAARADLEESSGVALSVP
jgi:cobalt-zinc-cadmium efflux system outer membrane protein